LLSTNWLKIPDNKHYLEFPVGEARQTAGSGAGRV